MRTSNPGAQEFQDLDCEGAPLWVRVAERLTPIQDRLVGQSDWSSLMVVCGATWPEEAQRLRKILPKTLFLVPGYGAQGGAASDALAGLVRGANGHEGGVVSSSRAILYSPNAAGATTLAQWRTAFSDQVDATLADLKAASDSVASNG